MEKPRPRMIFSFKHQKRPSVLSEDHFYHSSRFISTPLPPYIWKSKLGIVLKDNVKQIYYPKKVPLVSCLYFSLQSIPDTSQFENTLYRYRLSIVYGYKWFVWLVDLSQIYHTPMTIPYYSSHLYGFYAPNSLDANETILHNLFHLNMNL